MKPLLALLLVANLAALAWVQGWVGDWFGTELSQARQAEIEPQRLVVVPQQRLAPPRAAEDGQPARQ